MTVSNALLVILTVAVCWIGGVVDKRLGSISATLRSLLREQEATNHAIGRLRGDLAGRAHQQEIEAEQARRAEQASTGPRSSDPGFREFRS